MSVVVIGGGVVGAAVARVASRTSPVLVASRTQRAHAGLWQRFDLADRVPPAWGSAQRVVVAVGGAEADVLRTFLARLALVVARDTRVVVVAADAGPGALALRSSPAWDLHERSIQTVIDAMRRGATARLPRTVPTRRWIWAEDLARVALDPGLPAVGLVEIQGPALLDREALRTALEQRGGGHCGTDLFRQVALPAEPDRDDWDEARWGVRRRL